MLGAAVWLTVVTLAGLASGFAREWLLVADWGVGPKTDAFLVAMFIPDAVRTMLAGGLLSAAALPLWHEFHGERRAGWFAGQVRHWLMFGCVVAVLLAGMSSVLVDMVGPGLLPVYHAFARDALFWLALVVPGLMLQAILSVPAQARGHFLLPGAGSILFNLPAVGYLWHAGHAAQPAMLAQCFVVGSVLMAVILLPDAWRHGWRPWHGAATGDRRLFWKRLWPLLTSSLASQGLVMAERLVASLLGAGAITFINLARKLVNIPLIGLMSLNQIVLAKMSGSAALARRKTLDRALWLITLLTLPAAVVMIAGAPAIVDVAFPGHLASGPLPALVASFAATIIFGSWNAMLARYYYAHGNTHTPLSCELTGSAVQLVLLFVLARLVGLHGVAWAVLGGVLTTAVQLVYRINHGLIRRFIEMGIWSVLLCGLAGWLMSVHPGMASTNRLLMDSLFGLLVFGLLLLRFRHVLITDSD